jgi:DNA-binding transcriptional regulator YiaG
MDGRGKKTMETTMTKHADERPEVSVTGLRVHGAPRGADNDANAAREQVLPEYDATVFVGLKTTVYNAAIERIAEDGEETIELPQLPELLAATAVARCLMPERLHGPEIKAIRRIMKMTLEELAKEMDARTAAETVSRWESGQPMSPYAEKVLRLCVCEQLREAAPGIEYRAGRISRLQLRDTRMADDQHEPPTVKLWLVRQRVPCSDEIIEAWNEKKAA